MNKNKKFRDLFALAASILLLAGCSAAPTTVQKGKGPAPSGDAAGTSLSKARIADLYGSLPLLFVRNNGQFDEEVSYYQRSGGWSTWFTRDGIVLSGGEILEISFDGGAATPEIIGEIPLETKVNYFTGNDPGRWRAGIPTFAAVRYREVWPGIDLRFYGKGRQLEYDVIAEPGADIRQVGFLYRGAENLLVKESGDLDIVLKEGIVIQRTPVIYQRVDGDRVSVDGAFVVEERAGGDSGGAREFVLSFEIGAFDDRYALVIDPVILYSTYLGGSVGDAVNDITVDPDGYVYVSGNTASANFPVAGTPYQGSHGGGTDDAFVAKFDTAGTSLVYSTYLGGAGNDTGSGVALDSSGNLYVTGKTDSGDFPTFPATPPLPFQPSHGGGQDAFVTKINSAGSALVYSTYLGGSGNETGEDIMIDSGGNAFIAGGTGSANFPLSASPFQDTHGGGAYDIFATKLNPDGTALVYSTFIGGDGNDYGFSIPFDESGNVFITGYTGSTDFPTTTGAYQETSGGQDDAFVTKLNSAGDALAYSSYLGGSSWDYGFDVAIDGDGSAYITGETFSTDFPTLNPIQPANAGEDDVFVTKLNSAGSSLVYSTYLGGAESDYGEAIIVDDAGMAVITGDTWSSDFPVKNAFQGTTGGSADAIVAQLNPSGKALVYSSYLGGSGQDYGWGGIARCSMGCIYVAGATSSTDFPATPSALQGSSGGGRDGFVAKISPASVAGDWNGDGTPDILWRNYSSGADYLWYMGMTMGNHVMTGEASLPTVPVTSWRIEGHPDFNMDGMPDILWRNYSSGANYIWYMGMTMGNHVMTGGAGLPAVTTTSTWRIGGTPDCNGDGVPDILWRNYSGGDNYIWYMGMTMGNPVVTGGAALPGVSSSDWWIDASGDMNGDGHPDILWRDYDTGANYVWFLDMTMGNPVVTGGAELPAQPDVDWVIEGLSDMNGDGAPDILWRNYLNGANYLWYMGATMGSPVVTGGASLPAVPDWNWETGE